MSHYTNKNQIRMKSFITTIFTMILILSFILPQVIALTPTQSNSIASNITIDSYKSELLAEDILFVKPVLKKMYIFDKTEVTLFRNKSIIIGPITLQTATNAQNPLISVKYSFIDMNNNSLGQDIVIDWSEDYPNFDYYYSARHTPFSSVLPSIFKIIATVRVLSIPYASTSITVYKIF